jgi:hypothetical protein
MTCLEMTYLDLLQIFRKFERKIDTYPKSQISKPKNHCIMKYLSLVFFTFVLWNCTPPTASIDLEAEQAALTTAAQSYYQLMNDHNWEGLEAIYSPSGQLIPDQKTSFQGEAGIQKLRGWL